MHGAVPSPPIAAGDARRPLAFPARPPGESREPPEPRLPPCCGSGGAARLCRWPVRARGCWRRRSLQGTRRSQRWPKRSSGSRLLNSIKPGLVKKINRLPTPIAGLDNIALFLRGCKELGLKESQLFDPVDLQDNSSKATVRNLDCSRKLKNVLVTIYWLGKTANSSTGFSGATFNLREFEGLLTQLRKETEDVESPKRSIRDSGYVDCWDSERSDSLSPPRHGRDDSFDSLDSFGSRSQQTPSPDVVLRGSSDGRGSDSESDLPHRKLPDVKKDDMSARRTSYGEPKSVVPFNQYLPNKSNQTAYIPAPLRKKKAEREEFRKSWSTATSPLGGERPFSEVMDACNSSLSDACADSQKQTPSSLSEWHESSEEEMDGSFPDIERDDMLARRFGTFQKSTSPLRPSCPPISVVSYRPLKQQGKERKTLQKAERSSPLTCATRHCLGTPSPVSLSSVATCEDGFEKSKDQDEHRTNPAGGKAGFRNPGKDDMMVRRTRDFPKQTGPSVSQFLPVPFSKQQNGGEATKDLVKTEQKVQSITVTDSAGPEKHPKLCAESPQKLLAQPEQKLDDGKHRVPGVRQDGASSAPHKDLLDSKPLQPGDSSEMQLTERNSQGFASLKDGHAQTFGSRTPVSDDAESVSMFDMRCADEAAVMQPHSQARHEKLQTIHHQLKEEEDRWQDDLARWKSRRRSASQDLFKKEAERKKMERLLTGTEEASERRKSIKTYREIVEEKERRERALHEAYKNARSREEADNILQQYIERFTISEAVLERLEMPKILERSHSAEPNSSSPPKDPNPLRYLRQQSLPAPKYTAKVEATIAPAGGSEASVSPGRTSPSKPFVSKAVPMLTAKPYSQPKSTQQVLRTFKVDGKVSMNGEAVNGVEEERERECTTLIFAPSPSRSPKSNSAVDSSSVEGEQNSPSTELVLKRLIEHSKDRAQTGVLTEEAKSINQNEKTDSERLSPDHKEFSTTVSRASPTVAMAEFSSVTNSSLSNHRKEMGSNEEPKKLERGQLKDVEAPVIQKVETLEAPVQDGSIIFPLLKIIPERSQVVLQNSAPQAGTENSDKSNRFGCWSWDPEEERKRQERWQHEQERVLQERYQKEQDKLKEEWEKAQKEVEEEERKYYEEERKIIEDTVVPFTVTSSSAEPLSTSSSVTDGNGTVNMVDVSYSEEEDKQKEDRTRKNLFSERDGVPFSKSKEYEPWKENMSTVNKEEYIRTSKQRGNEQDPQMSRTERLQPTEMTLPLCQDVTWNQQSLTKQSPRVSDTKQKNFPSEHNLGLPVSSAREMRRAGCRESSGAGRSSSSPCSPTTQSQSPNRYKRSVSGKKLCSSCGQPLGKGAAMIIETLGLYFHIQCFRCGICKGQLGDAASGTDVRIRSGLLNCNDCYIRSRTAGQPTTL
ncbi:LIM and calponin homology domains-containing protein 1 isoform X8 [Podarcis muralis]